MDYVRSHLLYRPRRYRICCSWSSVFFSSKKPIVSSTLHVEVDGDNSIVIKPFDEISPEFNGKKLRFFEDYVYVDGEGFSELSAASRLPAKYRQPIHIDPKDEDAMVVALSEIIEIDESINELANLPLGWKAVRESKYSEWKLFEEE